MSIFTSGSLPLFIKCEETSFINSSLYLTAQSTTNSGISNGLSLYLYGEARASGSLPISVTGYGTWSASGSLPLIAAGTTERAEAYLSLYVQNSGVSGSLTIWASGGGSSPGSIPFSGSLPLFMKRSDGAVLNLFVQGAYPASGSVPIYACGTHVASGHLSLAVPDVDGGVDASMSLYTRGW
jgi:hypothetical protein